ncbi:hypothetical protein [Actinocorallia libanotica]|uniref:Uncharacterized protein n=1 Tax=Actinocorallia libanotica TaxID=46162 RepID=A0ABN1QXR8_9ACTN
MPRSLPPWTGYTLFQDHAFGDYDDLRRTVLAQLDNLENAAGERRVRITPPRRSRR